MLQHTFIHAPGVGARTESDLWRDGAHDWNQFERLRAQGRFTSARHEGIARTVAASRRALESRDAAYFGRALPSGEMWRMYEAFTELAAYVDIETTGLSSGADDITVVAMHAGGRTSTFVRGEDLEKFPAAVQAYPLVVTFNGACFDLPFLASEYSGWKPPAHIDLRYPLRRAGYRGGLKLIEQQAGIRRPAHLREVDGWEAVRLWHRHQRGDREALPLLLEYASADVENLPPLAELVVREMRTKLGFGA